MAVVEPIPEEEFADLPVSCPECGWVGRVAQAVCRVDEVVQCPECGEPVVRKGD